ncbi:hypothetical protein RHGRI_010369 [Rhododendron griersonianum]|uniref:Uncharacterized protein n=1 Tax=Rhododendron griersonianum TaxID=479676 RepID=A0AAV6KI90_9ERIC|nr:hypothetical protein RHGRI_010369 [Rhododendron griersonianum]
MGISFSCPFADFGDADRQLEAFLARSISFDGRESENGKMKSYGSRRMIIEGSVSFKRRGLETKISFRGPSDTEENVFVRREIGEQLPADSVSEKTPEIPLLETDQNVFVGREIGEQFPTDSVSEKTPEIVLLESEHQRCQAALKLQKVYKSLRTRRQLADCAVLVEQSWWKLLDFAELNQSSTSFFDIEKPETAISRWSRARKQAAKVGKGLSKDESARKLALQHWLEAIDPRHRYGHNLQFYYVNWLHCESKQPFFYWLDIGEGKEVNLDKCLRAKLQQQCIKYLGPTERKAYEIAVENGKLFYSQTGMLLDTKGGPQDAKWIFVLSTSKTLYVGQKHKGTFQHSSFLAGGATLSAGRLVVEEGILKAVWPHSGHYLPTEENFEEFMLFMKEHSVDLSRVQRSPTDGEEEPHGKNRGFSTQHNLSLPDFTQVTEESNAKSSAQEETISITQDCSDLGATRLPLSRFAPRENSKVTVLEIPSMDDVIEMFQEDELPPPVEIPSGGYETAEEVLSDDEFMVSKQNLFEDQDQETDFEEVIPKEKIIQRINSQERAKSYQFAHRLSFKWTTGAGPRIGCVRDYPSEIQNRALEEMNLSPRSSVSSPRRDCPWSPRVSTPTKLCRETVAGKSPLAFEQAMLDQVATP